MLTQAEVLVRVVGLTEKRLDSWITQAWIRPVQAEAGHVFDEADLARLHLIVDLTELMGVNDEAIPIILSLVDQVQTLRVGIRALDLAVATQDGLAADAIAARLRDLLSE
jgi:chaperone modulatory protein CbpM